MASERVTVRGPEVCPTCGGEVEIDVQVGPRHYVAVPCPDCCCPCGVHTGGGLCEACDWVDDDYRRKVTEGSR